MLREINFENMAIFSSSDISFYDGMSVLTGETGAGKSLIIGAISLLLGARTCKPYIREEGQSLHIEALFSTEDVMLSDEERALYGDELLISRDVLPSGRSSVRVNHRMMTSAALKELGQKLICIHGQHDNQALLNESTHIRLLDDFIKISKETYQALYEEHKRLQKRKIELETLREDAAKKTDYLSYVIDEIEKINPKPGEDEELQEQKNRLAHAEKLKKLLHDAQFSFSGKGEEGIGECYRAIKSAVIYDSGLSSLEEKLIELYDLAQTIGPMLSNAIENIPEDSSALSSLLDRISDLEQLKRKYGGSISQVLSFKEECQNELENIVVAQEESVVIDEKIKDLEEKLTQEASCISKLRHEGAEKLSERITEELQDLGMEKATFRVNLSVIPLGQDGQDKVQFQIETNPGVGYGPLSKIASGGELSRVMLALKAALHEIDATPTIIFDEIDVGVSGSAAAKIGKKMREVSQNCQVIAVTHLQQIAAYANTHYKVMKEEQENSYVARVEQLTEENRVLEIVRLMVGDDVSQAAIIAAKELLNGAKNG